MNTSCVGLKRKVFTLQGADRLVMHFELETA